jgi:hypothetical protein
MVDDQIGHLAWDPCTIHFDGTTAFAGDIPGQNPDVHSIITNKIYRADPSPPLALLAETSTAICTLVGNLSTDGQKKRNLTI